VVVQSFTLPGGLAVGDLTGDNVGFFVGGLIGLVVGFFEGGFTGAGVGGLTVVVLGAFVGALLGGNGTSPPGQSFRPHPSHFIKSGWHGGFMARQAFLSRAIVVLNK
jgi:hypothetical protein